MAIQINGTSGISGVDGSAATPALQGTDSNTGISFGTDTVSINTGGTARATVDSSGRLGVGTTSPITTQGGLDVSSGGISLVIGADNNAQTRTNSAVKVSRLATPHYTNAEEPFGLLFGISDSSTNELYVGGGTTAINAATDIRFHTASNNTTTSGSERARIDSSGRLLVGTSSARSGFFNGAGGTDGRLLVETTSNINAFCSVYGAANDGGSYLVLAKHRSGSIGGLTAPNSGNELGGISFQGADGTKFIEAARIQAFADGTPGANNMPGRLSFYTNNGTTSTTERMRIGNNGFFRFFDSSGEGLFVGSSQSAGTTYSLFAGLHSASAVGNGTYSIAIRTNGNVVNTNNSYGSLSDIKLKENIVEAGSQWDDIKALQVRKYNFKEGQTHTQIGLVAQEVELVSPGLVTESPDRDTEGNDLGTVTKSVNYSVLYMKAVKALQEAMERIESLEARLTTLEGGTN